MPLTSKEKVARHRARVNADPAARANYLAKRGQSYQRRKRQGKITNIPVADLSREKQVQMRKKWKQYQRQYREKKRVLAEVLNLTPPSLNSIEDDQLIGPPEPIVVVADHDYVQPSLERPQASSTPRKVDKLKVNKGKEVSVRNTKRDKKKIAEEKKERVVGFLCRDENSRMLSDLHSNYNTTALKHHAVSYRQFLRYCPFYVTQAKESDRNTCSCFDHDNFKIIVDRLCQKGILLTNSISELLETIVCCDPTNQKCMYRLCTKCSYNEVEFEGPLDDSIITWE
ncbi:hypothetical protein JOQ06_004249, partial [Pogonophryne albipinna]